MTATTPDPSLPWGDRTDRRRRHTGLTLLVCAGLCLTGCSGGDESAARAGAYVDAMHEASNAEFAHLAQFAAPDAAFDMVPLYAGAHAIGRPAIAQMLREDWDVSVRLSTDQPPYVSSVGAIDPSRIGWESFDVPQAPVLQMSSEGFLDYAWHASISSGSYYVGIDPGPPQALADAYLAAWDTGQGFDALYAPGALVTDSLLGVGASGPAALAEAAAEPAGLSLRGAVLRQIPGTQHPSDGGPALYLRNERVDGRLGRLASAVLLLDVPGPQDCPGQVGVLLSLDEQGTITGEERFHRMDAVDRCLDLDGLDPWWTDVDIPDPGAMPEHTGTLSQGRAQVALWDTTASREQLLRWALGAFADGLLPPPEPDSVTFAPPDADPWTTHGFVAGSADIPLPGTAEGCPEQGCDQWPAESRAEALSALAHVWLADPARRPLRQEYAATLGTAWTDPSAAGRRYPPLGPVAHQAAHTIAWGLMDEPYPLPDDIADLPCEQLAADFMMLTTAVASGSACASA